MQGHLGSLEPRSHKVTPFNKSHMRFIGEKNIIVAASDQKRQQRAGGVEGFYRAFGV